VLCVKCQIRTGLVTIGNAYFENPPLLCRICHVDFSEYTNNLTRLHKLKWAKNWKYYFEKWLNHAPLIWSVS